MDLLFRVRFHSLIALVSFYQAAVFLTLCQIWSFGKLSMGKIFHSSVSRFRDASSHSNCLYHLLFPTLLQDGFSSSYILSFPEPVGCSNIIKIPSSRLSQLVLHNPPLPCCHHDPQIVPADSAERCHFSAYSHQNHQRLDTEEVLSYHLSQLP